MKQETSPKLISARNAEQDERTLVSGEMEEVDPRERVVRSVFEALAQLQDRELLWLFEAARRMIFTDMERTQLEAAGITRFEQPPRYQPGGPRQRRADTDAVLASLSKRLACTDAILEMLRSVNRDALGKEIAEQLWKRRG